MVEHFPEVFQAFFDDAAVFPPGLALLPQAVTDHIVRRGTALAPAVGPLILPLKDLTEAKNLAAAQDLSAGPIQVSAVTPAGELHEALTAIHSTQPELTIAAIELKTNAAKHVWSRELEAAAAVDGPQVFVELTELQIADGALDLLAGTNVRLKFRTGGIRADLFPTIAQLAAVLTAAAMRDIPFKLTAGLHQGVRYTNSQTEFTHHGFLNIAIAAAIARDNAGSSEVEAVLAETEAAKLIDQFRSLSAEWRQSFMSFGTCSVSEPAESLEALNLLPAGIVPQPIDQKVDHS